MVWYGMVLVLVLVLVWCGIGIGIGVHQCIVNERVYPYIMMVVW
jgi:hypothetical protein